MAITRSLPTGKTAMQFAAECMKPPYQNELWKTGDVRLWHETLGAIDDAPISNIIVIATSATEVSITQADGTSDPTDNQTTAINNALTALAAS